MKVEMELGTYAICIVARILPGLEPSANLFPH
jgi:hypothetical protein